MITMLNDDQKLARNKQYIDNPDVRAKLFKQFMPTFFYHKDEESFPLHPDDFVKDIIEAKYNEYTNIEMRQKRKLNNEEQKELEIIQKYFWKDGKFNPDYKKYENQPDFREMINPQGTNSKFLVFDEKKYGYATGTRLSNAAGVPPKGHPRYDPKKPTAPIATSIIPTKEGFFIQYESTYALNNAIKGTGWLRNILPSNLADKADNFGFHYGDCEGVGIYVKVDDEGRASMRAMQTFAHGRSGAREVPVENCTFKDGRPSVFVGLGGHPSYADHFVGRNKFMDVVGDAYSITPESFIDVSPDKIEKKSPDIPSSLNTFSRLADSNPMVFSDIAHPKNEKELEVQSKKWHQYEPSLLLTKVWNKIKSGVQTLFGNRAETTNTKTIQPVDINSIIKSQNVHQTSQAIEQSQNVMKDTKWTKTVGTKEERVSLSGEKTLRQ